MSQQYHFIGLMSGTSGDGLDIAYCQFIYNNSWEFRIKNSDTISFPDKLGNDLKYAHLLSARDLQFLDLEFGRWMGEVSKEFIVKYKLNVQAIASHGHTVFHQPEKGLSLQIGNGWALHQASGLPVINDFRMLDVQLGGQGAPLVPIGDQLLFNEFDYCINLGGIANISMEKGGERVAFDICPFNLLLNHYAQQVGLTYDIGGAIARKGTLSPKLLVKLNKLSYYQIIGAKSLGREDLDQYFEILDHDPVLSIADKLHTLIAHYVLQIKKSMTQTSGKVLVTGGGTFNTYFMEELQKALGETFEIPISDPTLINYKEALVFAFLGVLKLRNEHNSLASVTGASRDSCGGTVYGM